MRDDLKDIFDRKEWGRRPGVPRSGWGSTLKATRRLRAALPGLFERYRVARFLDAPCGDWTWMQEVDLAGIDYLGCDIAPSVVDANRQAYGDRDGVRFGVLDITHDPLPDADLMMVRDCLFHLDFDLRWTFFENFAASSIPYLLLTVNHVAENRPLPRNGGFRAFNPMRPPFNLPAPLEYVPENVDALPADIDTNPAAGENIRSLAVWSRDQIAEALAASSQHTGADASPRRTEPEHQKEIS